MSTLVNVAAAGAGAIFGLMVLLWLVSLLLENASIVDIFWGLGFAVTNGIYLALGGDVGTRGARSWLLTALVTVWGLRLGLYLLWRNWGKVEDFRYRKWRQEAGASWWWRSLFRVFLLQGFLMWIISAPLLAVHVEAGPKGLIWLDVMAVSVWSVGFFFETVGDLQLARFKSDPANEGRVMDRGVWRYTRHPNYFGDATQWWAYYLIALSAGGAWTIFSPVLMTVLLLQVSGVTLLEKTLKESKPGYEAYEASTSAFIPWFPRDREHAD